MTDLLVYGTMAAIALGPIVWPILQASRRKPGTSVKPNDPQPSDTSDWRQPWVGRLMDLQRVLEEKGNTVASDTTKRLVTEIIYDGKPTK